MKQHWYDRRIGPVLQWFYYCTMPAAALLAVLLGFSYSRNPAVDRPLSASVAGLAVLAWVLHHPHRFDGMFKAFSLLGVRRAPLRDH
jgi:hypothetical protein